MFLGGEAGFARQCIENIVNGKYNLLLQVENSTNSEPQKQTRDPKIYLPGISSCQVSFLLKTCVYAR